VLLIVQRSPSTAKKVLWKEADARFDDFNPADLQSLVSAIGTDKLLRSAGDLHLLNPTVPLSYRDFPLSEEQRLAMTEEFERQKKAIEEIKDPQNRSEVLRQVEKQQNRLALGAVLNDRQVTYNPSPITQFSDVLHDTWRTLSSLFSGKLNPKFVAGPVGIVQIVHYSWTVGVKEALYWMAVISMSLGLVNLLPLPVLDGGHIVLSAVEWVTKRPLKAKTMERLIIPFVGLLIAFFIYITYQDISRLFGKFF
jgi:regulator of sigma E protease